MPKILVRLILFGADPMEVRGAELPMALELALSRAASLLCLKSDLGRPFSCDCYNLSLAADSDNGGAN